MGKGAKIAIGCIVIVVLVGVGITAVVVGGAWWAKGKVTQFAEGAKRLEELHAKANAHPFTPPADGVIQEPQLVRFLEIRKDVYAVYLQHKDEIDALNKKKEPTLGDTASGFGVLKDIFQARAEAQARVGMSDAEYAYLIGSVYKSAWASEVAKAHDGKTPSELIGESYKEAAEGADRAQKELAEKRAAGDAPASSERGQKEFQDAVAKLKEGAPEARQALKSLDVPPANLALFHKYEADINKYSMKGLEALGF